MSLHHLKYFIQKILLLRLENLSQCREITYENVVGGEQLDRVVVGIGIEIIDESALFAERGDTAFV